MTAGPPSRLSCRTTPNANGPKRPSAGLASLGLQVQEKSADLAKAVEALDKETRRRLDEVAAPPACRKGPSAKANGDTVRLPWPRPKSYGPPRGSARLSMICLIGASSPARALKRSRAGDGAMPCIRTTGNAPRPFGAKRCDHKTSTKQNIACSAATVNTETWPCAACRLWKKTGA